MREPRCSAMGCDEPAFEVALLDEQPYCVEHYPERSRYDTTLTDAEVLCAVCHQNFPGTTFCEDVMEWRCPVHHPDNAGKTLIVDRLGNVLYAIGEPSLGPENPPEPKPLDPDEDPTGIVAKLRAAWELL